MIVKVCGMRDPDNIRAVAEAGADWMGFIFYPRSPRCFDRASIPLPDAISRVGVFVNEKPERILAKAGEFGLDYLQLHGKEPVDECRLLREAGYPVIKAISVSSAEDVLQAIPYEGEVDYFLFDTKCKGYGGSGRQFDWSVLESYQGETPFLLCGGISPGSITELEQFRHPLWAGIDLNSGFETAPANKDEQLLKLFIGQFKSQFK